MLGNLSVLHHWREKEARVTKACAQPARSLCVERPGKAVPLGALLSGFDTDKSIQ